MSNFELADLLAQLPVDDVRSIMASRQGIFDYRMQQNIRYEDLLNRLAVELIQDRGYLSANADLSLSDMFVLARLVQEGKHPDIESIVNGVVEQDRPSIFQSLQRLTRVGLAITVKMGSRWECFVPPSAFSYSRLPPCFAVSIADIVLHAKADVLRRMVDAYELDTLPNKSEAAMAICGCFADTDRMDRILDGLSPVAKRIFTDALNMGGTTTLIQASTHLESRHRSQVFVYDWFRTWWKSPPRNPMEELMSYGILVTADPIGYAYGRFFVPREVGSRYIKCEFLIDRALAKPEFLVLESSQVAPFPPVSRNRDLAILMSQFRVHRPVLTSKGTVHRNFLKTTARLLSVNEPAYANYLYSLAWSCGLLSHSDGIMKPSMWWKEFIGLSPQDSDSVTDAFWIDQFAWHEEVDGHVLSSNGVIANDFTANWRSRIRQFLNELSVESGGAWVDLDSLCDRFYYYSPALTSGLQPQREVLAQFKKDYPGVMLDDEGTDQLNPIVLRTVQSLRYLGRAEVGISRDGTKIAVRELPRSTSPAAINGNLGFTIQANHEVFAPTDLPMDVLYNLACIAEPISENHYRLTNESVRRALDVGFELAEIREFLANGAVNDLPQNVSVFLDGVEGQYGRIRVGTAGVYVVCDSPELLQELSMNTRTGVRVIDTPSPTVAIVDTANVETALKLLRKAGYAPTERLGRVGRRNDNGDPMGLMRRSTSIRNTNLQAGQAPTWAIEIPQPGGFVKTEISNQWVARLPWARFEAEAHRGKSK